MVTNGEGRHTTTTIPPKTHTQTRAHVCMQREREREIMSCILVTIHKHFNIPFLFPLG